MFCTRCGNRNAGADAFCTRCGAAFAAAATKRHPLVPSPAEDQDVEGVQDAAVCPLLVVRRGHNAGSRFALAKGRTTLGRDAKAVIFLNDITVSRNHAVVVYDDNGCTIADQGSLNGTYVNGRLIDEPISLRHGDELQIGVYKLECRYSAASPSAQGEDLGPDERSAG